MSKDANEELHRNVWSAACAAYYLRLLSYARQLTGDGDIAAEIVHNVVIKILKLVPEPENVGDKLNYLLRSVHNAWADWLRKTNKVKTISIDDTENTEIGKIEAPESDAGLDKESKDAYRLALKFELRRLNRRDKRLLVLHLKKYKTEQIAVRMHEDKRIVRHDLNVVINRVHKRLTSGKAKAKGIGSGRQ
jgi:RNA polymerase sigma factor (sigma-70 family)